MLYKAWQHLRGRIDRTNLQGLRVGVIEELNFNLILKEWEESYRDKKEGGRIEEKEHPVTLGDDRD